MVVALLSIKPTPDSEEVAPNVPAPLPAVELDVKGSVRTSPLDDTVVPMSLMAIFQLTVTRRPILVYTRVPDAAVNEPLDAVTPLPWEMAVVPSS